MIKKLFIVGLFVISHFSNGMVYTSSLEDVIALRAAVEEQSKNYKPFQESMLQIPMDTIFQPENIDNALRLIAELKPILTQYEKESVTTIFISLNFANVEIPEHIAFEKNVVSNKFTKKTLLKIIHQELLFASRVFIAHKMGPHLWNQLGLSSLSNNTNY